MLHCLRKWDCRCRNISPDAYVSLYVIKFGHFSFLHFSAVLCKITIVSFLGDLLVAIVDVVCAIYKVPIIKNGRSKKNMECADSSQSSLTMRKKSRRAGNDGKEAEEGERLRLPHFLLSIIPSAHFFFFSYDTSEEDVENAWRASCKRF